MSATHTNEGSSIRSGTSPEGLPEQLSPESVLEQASRHLEASEISEALCRLEHGIELLREIVQAARVDAGENGSYAPMERWNLERRNRLSALREQTTKVIERLEAARREVEDELTTVRSQKAFERQATHDSSWIESRV